MKAYLELTTFFFFLSNSIHAFQLSPFPTTTTSSPSTRGGFFSVGVSSLTLNSKKTGDDLGHPPTLAVGTFVEFEEKNRVHAGKITKAPEHSKSSSSSSGGARYQVADREGKLFDISDKAIRFIIHPPNSPVASEKLFSEFLSAHDASEEVLHKTLDFSPDMFEMVWDESASASVEEEDGADHRMLLTPSAFVDLVHSHDASAIEKYMAWKILRTDMAHVYFKEVNDHGRVVSFKAKTRKAVDAAKQDYCNDHKDSDLCEV